MSNLMALVRARLFLFIVVLPTLIIWLYQAIWASPGYVARASVLVEHDGGMAVPTLDLGLFSLGSESSKTDALVAEHHIRSSTMLARLQQELDLRAHYSSRDFDWWQRMAKSASAEEFLDYYRAQLTTQVDQDSNVLTLELRAFDPALAHRAMQTLVRFAEEFVNDMSRDLALGQLEFLQEEVDAAHARLREASRELIDLQRDTAMLSPEQETEAAGQILGGLLQELSRQRTKQKALAEFLNPEAADLVVTRQRVKALEEQIQQERNRLVGIDGEGLNDIWLSYQDAEVNMKLATEVYKNALASLETTRMDAARKVKFMVRVAGPTLPEEAEYPRVVYSVLTAFVLLCLLYFVAGLFWAAVLDHRE